MTKLNRFAIAAVFGISTAAGLGYLLTDIKTSSRTLSTKATTTENAIKVEFRAPASVPSSVPLPENTHTKTGLSHPVWKERVEKTLLTQAAGNLKKAEIEKVDSFNWKLGKVDVKVDSVIVKLEHIKGHRSSFRAIVDASNGKILQTWDHPVLDNFGPKARHGVKIDPRYHND